MQAVVVVGDIDPDQIEAKIKTIFGEIPAPAQPTVKPVIAIPENETPQVAVLTDPEASSSSIEILWRVAPMPRQYRNTDVAFVNDIIKSLVGTIMSERFNDITSKSDAPFLGAQFYIGGLCESSDAVQGTVSFKDGEALSAFKAYLTEVEKMKRFGTLAGIAFQIKDDIFDYQLDNKTGKPAGNDIQEHKMTLPLIHLLKICTNGERRSIIRKIKYHSDDLNVRLDIINMVRQNHCLDYAEDKMNSFVDEALSQLSDIKDSEALASLKKLVNYCIDREK